MIPRTPVKSSNILSVGYQAGTLSVEFSGGGVYHYAHVPADVYQRLLAAESIGKFIGAEIKGKFVCEKQKVAA